MLMDPLMMVPLKDPVVLSSGFVVDRETAVPEGSAGLRFQRCPFSNQPLERKVYPLVFLQDKVQEWKLDRLNQAVAMAEELVSSGQGPGLVEQVFEIAEQFMDEVGDKTYIHMARRLAEAQRKSTVAKGPATILRMHQRLARVLGAEDLPAQVVEAMAEFTAEAQRHLDAGDAEAAASWLSEDIRHWLEQPEIRPHWIGTDHHQAWLELQLGSSKALADDEATRRWRQAIFVKLKQGGSPEKLAQWLREEGLEEDEFTLAPPFNPDDWNPGAGWEDAALGLARVGHNVHVEYTGPNLNPWQNCDWFLEVAFTAERLRSPDYVNVIFSQHGSGTGWEVRVSRRDGIELIFTTENGGHNEYTCGRGGQAECVRKWVHVVACFEWERSETTLFVNGERTRSHVALGDFKPASEPARLGQNPCWLDRYICGQVAFARVEHELPAASGAPLDQHIAALAQQRLGCLPVPRPAPECPDSPRTEASNDYEGSGLLTCCCGRSISYLFPFFCFSCCSLHCRRYCCGCRSSSSSSSSSSS